MPDEMRVLEEQGFAVLPGLVPPEHMGRLARAYDAAVSSAAGADVREGSTTTRVSDFVNRGGEFDLVYTLPPVLEACRRIIGRPFKLSSFHARTLRTGTPGQDLHVDVSRASADWPLAGFILMVDEFRADNGATRFVPGSHRWPDPPQDAAGSAIPAFGPTGSVIVFHGSAWHGHGSNASGSPRRSLQGAFIPREGQAATDFAARMTPETRSRLSADARDVLGL